MFRAGRQATLAYTNPEAELLLSCARTFIDDEQAERINALLQETIDWSYVIRAANAHGVTPLVYRSLSTTAREAVPKAALHQLEERFRANARRNVLLTRELLMLLHLLDGHGISAIPIKGPVLATSVYGDLSLRQFHDLDILVQKQDILRAKDLLISQGYQPRKQLTDKQEEAYNQSHHDYPFVRHDARVIVELQWGITQASFPFPLNFNNLRERCELVPLGHMRVRNLSPADLLLILSVHGSKHRWELLEWICDIAELIRVHPGLEWERVIKQAETLGGARMLSLGLFLAHDLLGASVPEGVLQRVQADSVVKLLAAQVRERLFTKANGPFKQVGKFAFYMGMRERFRDRVRLTLDYGLRNLHYGLRWLRKAITPNTKDQTFLPLPARLAFLYYLLRPVRVVSEYGLSWSKHFAAGKDTTTQ